jgi:hypothetical protein
MFRMTHNRMDTIKVPLNCWYLPTRLHGINPETTSGLWESPLLTDGESVRAEATQFAEWHLCHSYTEHLSNTLREGSVCVSVSRKENPLLWSVYGFPGIRLNITNAVCWDIHSVKWSLKPKYVTLLERYPLIVFNWTNETSLIRDSSVNEPSFF